MKKNLFVLLVTFALLCHNVTYGATLDKDYDRSTSKLTASIELDSKTAFTVTIPQLGDDDTGLSKDNPPIYLYFHDTDDNGSLILDIPLKNDMISGRYDLICTYEGGKISDSFLYVNENDDGTKAVLEYINSGATAGEILDYLSTDNNFDKIGLDMSDSGMSNYILPALEFCVTDADGDYTLDTFLDKYKLGIENAELVEQIRTARVYGDLRELIEKNYIILGISFDGDYADISSNKKYKVYTKMFEDRAGFSDIYDVVDSFDEAVADVLTEADKPSFSGGSGGGGSKPSGPIITIPPVDSAPSVPTQPFAPTHGTSELIYNDVDNHFSKDSVYLLSQKGVISGYPDGSFKPDSNVTRAEFSKMFSLLFDIKASGIASFTDVPADAWYKEFVLSLANSAIITGYNGMFMPDNNLTREDAALIIYRYLLSKGVEFGMVDSSFDDFDDVSDYARDAIVALEEISVMKGNNSIFNPKAYITRGEITVLLDRTNQYITGEANK